MPDYIEVLRSAFVELWAGVMLFLPKLLLAAIILLLGLLVANLLRSAIMRIVEMLKIDELMAKLEVKPFFARMGLELKVGGFLGWLAKWFVIVVTLIAAADALQWTQITAYLTAVVTYIPNVLIAVVILLVGIVLANFVNGVVRSAVTAAQMENGQFLAGVAKWAIIVFSFMAALVQLGIAASLVNVLFTGFVAMLAISGGLAFGLGGRDHASRVLDKLERDLTARK